MAYLQNKWDKSENKINYKKCLREEQIRLEKNSLVILRILCDLIIMFVIRKYDKSIWTSRSM